LQAREQGRHHPESLFLRAAALERSLARLPMRAPLCWNRAMLCTLAMVGAALFAQGDASRGASKEERLELDARSVAPYARLALGCVHKEYPNKIAHVLASKDDVAPPSKLTPAFHGCFDWHSAVHGHWMLARVLRTWPGVEGAGEIRAALAKSLTSANIAAEVAYLSAPGRATFERPYGLAGDVRQRLPQPRRVLVLWQHAPHQVGHGQSR